MIINTKFNIGNEVWIMYANKIRKGEITGFTYSESNNMCSWSNRSEYCINLLPDVQMHICNEVELFRSKEELINSL
jgi:hypothetical protein